MLVSSAPPVPSTVAQVRPSSSPCPQAVVGLVAFAIDPSQPIVVKASQSFIVALRSVGDAGYSWRVRQAAQSGVVRYERVFTIADVAFTNADRPSPTPGGPPPPMMVGGESTQYFLYTVAGPGSATLVFDLFAPGNSTPVKSKTFAVTASPNALVC